LKSIVKHMILGVHKRVSCTKKTSGPISTNYTSSYEWRIFAQEVAFWGRYDCTF